MSEPLIMLLSATVRCPVCGEPPQRADYEMHISDGRALVGCTRCGRVSPIAEFLTNLKQQ